MPKNRTPLLLSLEKELHSDLKSFNSQKVWEALKNSELAYATQADLIEDLEEKLVMERIAHRKQVKKLEEETKQLLRRIKDE